MPVSFTNIDRTGLLTFAHAGGAAIDDLTVNGTSDSDTFAVSGNTNPVKQDERT